MSGLRPFFGYYGSKWQLATRYPDVVALDGAATSVLGRIEEGARAAADGAPCPRLTKRWVGLSQAFAAKLALARRTHGADVVDAHLEERRARRERRRRK